MDEKSGGRGGGGRGGGENPLIRAHHLREFPKSLAHTNIHRHTDTQTHTRDVSLAEGMLLERLGVGEPIVKEDMYVRRTDVLLYCVHILHISNISHLYFYISYILRTYHTHIIHISSIFLYLICIAYISYIFQIYLIYISISHMYCIHTIYISHISHIYITYISCNI